MKVLVTGGAGLVGSSMCERLLKKGAEVFCVDNLSLGTQKHIAHIANNQSFQFENIDVSKPNWYSGLRGKNFDSIIHLAANSDISASHGDPNVDFNKTLQTTFETLRAAKDLQIKNFLFSSTSAVYGADPIYPTPENSQNMHPVSIYGAAKLASEAFISSFVENFGLNAWVYRFGNVVGKRLTHGVIFDFVKRLRQDSAKLVVLGNGMQCKTYIDVEDCTAGILWGFEKSAAGKNHKERFQVFNLSTDGATTVKEIAEESVKAFNKPTSIIEYGTSAVGWVGDVPKTSLDIQRMMALGWKPSKTSKEAIVNAIRDYSEWSK